MKLKTLLASALLATTLSVSALSAATVSVLGTVQGTEISGNKAPASYTGPVDLNITGTFGNLYKDIYSGTSLENVGKYNSIPGGSTMTYSLSGKAGSAFAFIWGTVDDYNFLTLNNVGGGTEVVGGQLVRALGNYQRGVTNLFVQITAENDFNSITLSSKGNSFEHAFTEPATIPVPAAGLLLLTAVGGLAMIRRKISK